MSWAAFIAAGVGPWVKRALAALGIGLISYVGLDALGQQVETAVQGALSGLVADIYQILALGGFFTVVNIWLAAIASVVTMLTVQRFGVLTR